MKPIRTLIKKWTAKAAALAILVSLVVPSFSFEAYAQNGTLRISTNIDQGAYTLSDATGALVGQGTGRVPSIFNMSAGAYRIDYQPVAGYQTPAVERVNVNSGSDQTFVGSYTSSTGSTGTQQLQIGSIRVSTNLAQGSYQIFEPRNPLPLFTGSGQQFQTFQLNFGAYLISFIDVTGYVTPSAIRLNLDATTDGSDFTGSYSRQQAVLPGQINISTTIDQGAYTLSDAAGTLIGQGRGRVQQIFGNLAPGAYLIQFQPVTDYIIRNPQARINLQEGQTLSVIGLYERDVTPTIPEGTLSINTDIPQGTFDVINPTSGVVEFSGSGTTVVTRNLRTGAYLVQFGDVTGYTTPQSIRVQLDENENERHTGVYLTGSITVQVVNQDGNAITDGPWTLRACTGTTLNTCTQNVSNGTAASNFARVPFNTYGIFLPATLPAAYVSAAVLSVNPQTINTPQQSITFRIEYREPQPTVATINLIAQASTGAFTQAPTVTLTRDDGTAIVSSQSTPQNGIQIDVTRSYTITFNDDAPGFSVTAGTSSQQIAANSLAVGSTSNFTGIYDPVATTATVDLVAQPSSGTFTTPPTVSMVRDDNVVAINNQPAPVTGVSIDVTRSYTITFSNNAAGYTLVSGGTQTIAQNSITAGTTQIFTATYDPIVIQQGTIAVTSNVTAATYTIRNDVTGVMVTGTGTQNFTADVGTYTLTPDNNVANFDPLAPIPNIVVTAGGNTPVTLNFIPSTTPTGIIAVTSNVTTATYRITNDTTGAVVTGTGTANINLVPGTYTLTPDNNVANFDPLAPIPNIVVTAGATTNVTLNFIPSTTATGILAVTSSLAAATYTITNDTTGAVVTGTGTQNFNLVPGTYTVTPNNNVAGFQPLSPVTGLLITANQTTPVTLTFVQQQGTIAVVSNVSGATYTIRNDATGAAITGTGTQNLTVDAGTYTLTPDNNVANFDPLAPIPNIVVTAGATTNVSLVFTANRGTLQVVTNHTAGSYVINDTTGSRVGQGGGISPQNFSLLPGVYTIIPGAVANFTTPATQTVTVISAQTIQASINYIPVNPQQGALTINTNNANGSYTVQDSVSNTVITGTGVTPQTVNLNAGNYTIIAGVLAGFTAPANQTVTIVAGQTLTVTVTYAAITTGTLTVNTNITAGTYTIRDSAGATVGTGSGIPAQNFTLPAGTYTVTAGAVANFTTPLSQTITLAATQTATVTLDYTATPQTGILNVSTTLNNGSYQILDSARAPIANGTGGGTTVTSFPLVPGTYIVQANPVANFVTPAEETRTIVAGGNESVTLSYVPVNTGLLNINTSLPNGSYTVQDSTGANVGTGSGTAIQSIPLSAGDYTVVAGAVAGFVTPANQTVTITLGQTTVHTVTYNQEGTLRVIPNQTAATYVVSNATGVSLTGTGERVFNLAPGVYTVTPNFLGGFQTPAITTTTVIPGREVIVPLTYVALPALTISKTVTQVNETLYNYRIHVINQSGQPQQVRVTDSVTGGNFTLTGRSGGQLTYVLNNGRCAASFTCADRNNNQQINEPTGLLLAMPIGSSAVITYEMRADFVNMNPGIISFVDNTATATIEIPGGTGGTFTATVSASLLRPQAPSGPSGGGGPAEQTGPRGGGHRMFTGDIGLQIDKFVSLDGGNTYQLSETLTQGVVIPLRRTSTIHTKVRMRNTGEVTIINAKLQPTFVAGDTDLDYSGVLSVEGAIYNEAKNEILVESILAGKTAEVIYTYTVTANGRQASLNLSDLFVPSAYAATADDEDGAVENLKVLSYKTRLADYEDGLTYHNIGDIIATHLFAGDLPEVVRRQIRQEELAREGGRDGAPVRPIVSHVASKLLKVYVVSDAARARAGELVNIMIVVENIAAIDLTNLTLTHDFDELSLEVQKAVGASNDGRELTWKRPLLRAGEKAQYPIETKVRHAAPVGLSRGTTRILFSQGEFPDQIENFLTIIDTGIQLVRRPASQLAATGPIGIVAYLLLIALLLQLGRGSYQRLRYVYTKRLALQEI